jgi:ABC-type sugar transport system substrate-binding protein
VAKRHEYDIVIFQRKPGHWRASVTSIIELAARRHGKTTLGFVTTEDSSSEESAAIAADQAIKELDS